MGTHLVCNQKFGVRSSTGTPNKLRYNMCIKQCRMTLLEIKERMSQFKKETNGKESYIVAEETDTAWPFPKTRPSSEGDDNED